MYSHNAPHLVWYHLLDVEMLQFLEKQRRHVKVQVTGLTKSSQRTNICDANVQTRVYYKHHVYRHYRHSLASRPKVHLQRNRRLALIIPPLHLFRSLSTLQHTL
jgi:intein-encoded DNA endonuclease-like protein